MKIVKKIKPLSINKAFQGKRFKTPAYKSYEQELLYTLPQLKMPEPPYKISFVFGFSNMCADIDNPIKLLTDIMQKKYGFNDRDILELSAKKSKVKKGEEFFEVELTTID